MTSDYAQYHGLFEQTLEAHRRYGASPRSVQARVHFYVTYLNDVVPYGITVHHVPTIRFNNMRAAEREEIRLMTFSGRIFMTGLVSLEWQADRIEAVAAGEAYSKWLDGEFGPNEPNWRFFTGLEQIKFCNSFHDDEWSRHGDFHPIHNAQQVAEYLQQEYDRLGENPRQAPN